MNMVVRMYHPNFALQWRHNGRDCVSNYQPHDSLLNGLFRRRSKKTWKLSVTGLCAGNSPGAGEFPTQMASYAENVSIWWRHHDLKNIAEKWTSEALITPTPGPRMPVSSRFCPTSGTSLTLCDLVMPYGDRHLGQHWPMIWFAPWRRQVITWTNVHVSSMEFCGIHLRAISQVMPVNLICSMCLEITLSELLPHFRGANELTGNVSANVANIVMVLTSWPS